MSESGAKDGTLSEREVARLDKRQMNRKLIGQSSGVVSQETWGGASGSCRRGTALVLVIALLGILFVVGVAFLQTMKFEAEAIGEEKKAVQKAGVFESLSDVVALELRKDFVDEFGIPYRPNQTQTLVKDIDEDDEEWDFRVSSPTYGDLPGVHGWIGQHEPDWYCPSLNNQDCNGPGQVDDSEFGLMLPAMFGDVFFEGTQNKFETRFDKSNFNADPEAPFTFARPVDTGAEAESAESMKYEVLRANPVDTDGDSVYDARQFELGWLGLADGQLAKIRARLNHPLNPQGKAYVGLRAVDHGAMVNVNHSHNLLLTTILADSITDRIVGEPFEWFPRVDGKLGYDPQIEERVLRRRHFLAPREVPPSKLHGNPLVPGNGNNPGDGHMGLQLLPPVDPAQHEQAPWWRWWPLDHAEPFYPGNPDRGTVWMWRMIRTYGEDGKEYDRRHLLTTISHDDLLMRGGRGSDGEDWIKSMADAYGSFIGEFPYLNPVYPFDWVPFDYHFYPTYDWPNSAEDYVQRALDGRRLLSLPWINDVLLADVGDTPGIDGIANIRGNRPWREFDVRAGDDFSVERAISLIQSAFTMLLLNAVAGDEDNRGEAWQDEAADDDYDGNGDTDRFDTIGLTAAALTANLIDFADSDGSDHSARPTRVAVRDSDPSSSTFGQVRYNGAYDQLSADVYGLERQPYITEVTAIVTEDASTPGEPDPDESALAVELFNPYDSSIEMGKLLQTERGMKAEWAVVIVEADKTFPDDLTPENCDVTGTEYACFDDEIPWRGPLQGESFSVIKYEAGQATGKIQSAVTPIDVLEKEFMVVNGGAVYLARLDAWKAVYYPVDEFRLTGTNIGEPQPPPDAPIWSEERMVDVPLETIWTCVVPVSDERTKDTQGESNAFFDSDIRQVEVNFANTGTLSHADEQRLAAFPTTGSLLLMMRHGNISGNALLDPGSKSKSFTSQLAGEFDDAGYNPIDNGRMPVFDHVETDIAVNNPPPAGNGRTYKLYRHHVDPIRHQLMPDPLDPENPHNPHGLWYLPGGSQYLPWGQLVFDYFTALGLETLETDQNWWSPEHPDAQPWVDLSGLRVSGRINVNTAPWSVLAGVPLIPANRFPEVFRAKMREAVLFPSQGDPLRDPSEFWVEYQKKFNKKLDVDQMAAPLGREAAQAIVAYREGRRLNWSVGLGQVDTTGYYGADRNLDVAEALSRRPGTGFLTVGELLNVRHADATSGLYRFDSGVVGRRMGSEPDEDYIEAISLIVALGDWVTTRSHVFTTFGTLRGEAFDSDGNGEFSKDEKARVNELAIRYQETLDRLLTVAGHNEEKPVRIGERTVSQYQDAFND